MIKCFVYGLFTLIFYHSSAQDIPRRVATALQVFEADAQMNHAIIGLQVVDSKTGSVVLGKNAQTGLAPASCQKVITSVASLDALGTDFRYVTTLGYTGSIAGGVLHGDLYVSGSGDPSFGSFRWPGTTDTTILRIWVSEIIRAGIKSVEGNLVILPAGWETAVIPEGWIWQDIGNYYGAGASVLNWHENQYDLRLMPGAVLGDPCPVVSTSPVLKGISFVSEVTTAAKGTGDRANIYLGPQASVAYVRGTIPMGSKPFEISGSVPDPSAFFRSHFLDALQRSGITVTLSETSVLQQALNKNVITTWSSPALDSINYWFLKKSVNLYGEALVKTLAFRQKGFGSTEKGVEAVRNFWAGHGIEKSAIQVMDGSGLSPQNRVTTDALVKVMQYARLQPWFPSFLNALPEINGIKMKSGSIGGARSYTGYINSANGKQYTFAFIVNNYDGSSVDVVRKMWKVLDVLK